MVAMVVHSAESQDEMKSVNQQRQHDVRAFFLILQAIIGATEVYLLMQRSMVRTLHRALLVLGGDGMLHHPSQVAI